MRKDASIFIIQNNTVGIRPTSFPFNISFAFFALLYIADLNNNLFLSLFYNFLAVIYSLHHLIDCRMYSLFNNILPCRI